MNDTKTNTVRVADIATTGQDRIDGPLLLDAIRDALDRHGAVRLSFRDMSCVTPSLINEAMVPLLEDSPIETLRTQVLLVDTTRHVADTVRYCMEHGTRWNAGEFAPLSAGDIARMPILDMEQDEEGRYQIVGDLHIPATDIPDHLDPFVRTGNVDDAATERLIEQELAHRPLTSEESLMESMMRPTLRDRGITVIRCGDEPRDAMSHFERISVRELGTGGFDHRAMNQAPRSYRRR